MDSCCKGSSVGALADVARERGARVFHCRLRPDHLGFVRGVRELIQHEGYDVLHNHLEAYSGVGVWVGRRDNVPRDHVLPQYALRPANAMDAPARNSRAACCLRSTQRTICGAAVAVRDRVFPSGADARGFSAKARTGWAGAVLRHAAQGTWRQCRARRPAKGDGMAARQPCGGARGTDGRAEESPRPPRSVQASGASGVSARLLCVGDGPLRPVVERGRSPGRG